jgi:60 kDa SS-A/Ro ribonucleoprotein
MFPGSNKQKRVVKGRVTSLHEKTPFSPVPALFLFGGLTVMSRINARTAAKPAFTCEGAVAARINPVQQLRRLVMAHLLWEDTFYVSGQDAAVAMVEAVKAVPGNIVRDIAVEVRTKMKLRHAPLLLARTMAGLPEHKKYVGETLAEIIQRPDELTEYLAMYWKDGRKPISKQSKLGLARAFRKFNEYSLAKYNRDDAVKLKDVLFLSKPKPQNMEQAQLWKKLAGRYCNACWEMIGKTCKCENPVEAKLAIPDTWEVKVTAAKGSPEQREQWEALLKEGKLGAMALLRNLRNFRECGVPEKLVFDSLSKLDVSRVLPFRFIAAARHNVQFESQIEEVMLRATAGLSKLPGKTALCVDNSGSMYGPKISKKSELERIDAACALAILTREMCERVVVIGFGTSAEVIPARRGFALRDAIKSGPGGGTNTRLALDLAASEGYDRIIVITDEQSHQQITPPLKGKPGYFMNVANYKNGIGYGAWTHLDGFSESLLQYIAAEEGLATDAPDTE